VQHAVGLVRTGAPPARHRQRIGLAAAGHLSRLGSWSQGRAEDSDGKTEASRRTISLDTFTVSALREDYQPSLLLFCHVTAGPCIRTRSPDASTGRRSCRRAADRLHDLRHTYATLSLDAGVHPKIVSDRVGHANMNVTQQICSHRSTGQDRDAAETFAAGLFGIVDGSERPHGLRLWFPANSATRQRRRPRIIPIRGLRLVAGAGFEPATSGHRPRRD
jgi:hypothetical protein